jgi:hypothetical protein
MSVQSVKGHLFTLTILNPDVAANTDIDFSTYMPKLDMDQSEPIVYMLLKDTTDGGATAETEYNPLSDRTAVGTTKSAGQYEIVDSDTIQLGDATDTASHTFRLEITGYWNFIQNT